MTTPQHAIFGTGAIAPSMPIWPQFSASTNPSLHIRTPQTFGSSVSPAKR